jgi:hypothetical protein
MKSVTPTGKGQGRAVVFPSSDEVAALRAWYAGLPSRQAIAHYLGQHKASGQSARAMISSIRRRLAQFAQARQRHELVSCLRQRGSPPALRACWAMLHTGGRIRRFLTVAARSCTGAQWARFRPWRVLSFLVSKLERDVDESSFRDKRLTEILAV